MSETDSFIQEVTEEVRQDQMFKLWKKWAPAILGGVAVIVGGAAYWSWQSSQELAEAQARGARFIAAEPGQIDAQLALSDAIDGPAKLVAEMTAAAALATDGQTQEAAKRYSGIAARADIAPEYRDLARLQAIRLGGTDNAMGELDAMIAEAGPYLLLAREHRAALRVQGGDLPGAHEDLRAVMADPQATVAMRQRALALLTATGGSVEGTGN